MKCVILAAGYATRLYPLTENYPKPLLKVGEKTILDWLIGDLRGSGKIDRFYVVSNAKFFGIFEKWAACMPDVTVIDDGTFTNETRLGAVRDVMLAIERADIRDDILVAAGDNVLDFSLSRFITFFEEKGTVCLMRYREPSRERLKKCGVMTVEEDGRVIRMVEKPSEPESEWCCPPFYIYRAEDLALIGKAVEKGCGTDAPGSLAAWFCSETEVFSMEMPGSRYDIGDTESYARVCAEYKGIRK